MSLGTVFFTSRQHNLSPHQLLIPDNDSNKEMLSLEINDKKLSVA